MKRDCFYSVFPLTDFIIERVHRIVFRLCSNFDFDFRIDMGITGQDVIAEKGGDGES